MSVRSFGDNWNFWTVKYLRQMRHDKALLLVVIVLLLVQFLIFRNMFEEVDYSPSWPWWLPTLLIFCSIGTMLCMALGFANLETKKEANPGLSHFIGFAPLDAGILFRGFLSAYLLTFGVVFVSCAPVWLTAFYYFSSRIPVLLTWMGEAFFLTLFLIQPDTRRWIRADLLAAIVFLVGWMQSWFFELPVMTTLAVCGILAAWQMLGLHDALRSRMRPCGILPRIGQLGLLLAGWGLTFSPFRLTVPIFAVMGALAALASMSGALDNIPERQLATLPPSRFRRLLAFLFYGSSAGGWLWCWAMTAAGWWILACYKESSFWEFVLTWGLFWAETAFLLVRKTDRRRTRRSPEFSYHVIIPSGLAVSGVMLVMFLLSSRLDGEKCFHYAGLAGWGLAAVMFFPQIPHILRDLERFWWRAGE